MQISHMLLRLKKCTITLRFQHHPYEMPTNHQSLIFILVKITSVTKHVYQILTVLIDCPLNHLGSFFCTTQRNRNLVFYHANIRSIDANRLF